MKTRASFPNDRMALVERISQHGAPFVADMIIENCGGVIVVRVITLAAVRWVSEKVQRGDYQPYYPSLVCEPRYVGEIIDAARADGLVIR